MKFSTILSPSFNFLLLLALVIGLFQSAGANTVCNTHLDPPETVTLTFGQVFTNPGDTFEIPVFLEYEDTPPSTVNIFVDYDGTKIEPFGDFYETVLMDEFGDPVQDEDGNSFTVRSIVRPEAPLVDGDFLLDTVVHDDESAIAISLIAQGPNKGDRELPEGHILTIPFRTLPGAVAFDTIDIDGLADNEAIQIFDDDLQENVLKQSNAAVTTPGGVRCYYINCADGEVQMACFPVAEVPQNVSATQGLEDKVTISWTGIQTLNARYRVYRSDDSNFSNAVPLGEGWSTDTFFDDYSALAPVELSSPGCQTQFMEVHHYYWVVAQTPAGCEGDFSSVAEGWRGTATKTENLNASNSLPILIMLLALSILSRPWQYRKRASH